MSDKAVPPATAEKGAKKYRAKNLGIRYAWPMGIWFTIFFVVPLVIITVYSFLKKGLYGGVVWEFSLNAYAQMFSKSYGIVFLRTLWISVISSVITILIALPCGYAIARSSLCRKY